MFGNIKIELRTQKERFFYYNDRKMLKEILEIERLVQSYPKLKYYSEPKRQLLEGIIGEKFSSQRENMSNAYRYILEHHVIDDYNLHVLYDILSENQLNEYEQLEDKSAYRKKNVYIVNTNMNSMSSLSLPTIIAMGVSPEKIKEYMDNLFEFLENKDINPLLKSQIIHFYFIYVQPFYNVNKRTAKTLSLWYLMESNSTPYTILNRGISFNRNDYISSIKDSRCGNMTPFLETTLGILKKELQLQININETKEEYGLSREECETLEMLIRTQNLTLKEVKNLYSKYKGLHDKKVIAKKIKQLERKGIIILNKNTKDISLAREEIGWQYRKNYISKK